jgi:hypothetical protein
MYAELLIFPDALREQSLFPDAARKLVALATDKFPINPLVFNRQDDGMTVQGGYGTPEDGEGWGVPPVISFGSSRGCIRLVGLGPQGVEILANEAPILGTAIARHLGNSPYKFKTYSGDCTIEQGRPALYRIRQLVISKKINVINAHKRPDGTLTLESVDQLIRRAILGGILSQARFLDDSCGDLSRSSAIGTDDMVGLRILDGSITFGLIKTGTRAHALIVRNLVFSLNLTLSGPWYAGLLRSRGYGLIRKEVV